MKITITKNEIKPKIGSLPGGTLVKTLHKIYMVLGDPAELYKPTSSQPVVDLYTMTLDGIRKSAIVEVIGKAEFSED